jgi:uncharacterized protein (TIGR00251 family)
MAFLVQPAPVIVAVRVTANSPVQSIVEEGGRLKVKLKSKPVGGKANLELLKLVARHYGVSTRNVRLVKGAKSKDKLVQVL